MLKVQDLEVHYGLIKGVKGVSFEVPEGKIISLIGSNGAGKTSTLEGIINSVKTKGEVKFLALEISNKKTHQIVSSGISLVPEGRRVFINLSVDENLTIGGYNTDHDEKEKTREHCYELFPRLLEKKDQLAGVLSGGEQQMLAIARALMNKPTLLMLDEPSLGLAPKIVGEVLTTIQRLKSEGITILLVEQNAFSALKISDYCYVLENGEIVLEGTGEELLKNSSIKEKYLGA